MEDMIQEKLPSLAEATPEELAHAIFDVLDAKKAHHIKVLRVNDQTVITDYFVICSGNSSTQVKSLAGEVEYKLGLRDVDPVHFEGRDTTRESGQYSTTAPSSCMCSAVRIATSINWKSFTAMQRKSNSSDLTIDPKQRLLLRLKQQAERIYHEIRF